MMKTSRIALAVISFGLIFVPLAWAENGQAPATTSQRHVRHSQMQAPRAPVPQNSCDYDRAAGRCMIDLGYGRCIECSGGPIR
jgi:hypothetical protein